MTADIATAAHNAVAIASLAWQEALWRGTGDEQARERLALARVLTCAAGHGLTPTELAAASGLDAAAINELLQEATAGG